MGQKKFRSNYDCELTPAWSSWSHQRSHLRIIRSRLSLPSWHLSFIAFFRIFSCFADFRARGLFFMQRRYITSLKKWIENNRQQFGTTYARRGLLDEEIGIWQARFRPFSPLLKGCPCLHRYIHSFWGTFVWFLNMNGQPHSKIVTIELFWNKAGKNNLYFYLGRHFYSYAVAECRTVGPISAGCARRFRHCPSTPSEKASLIFLVSQQWGVFVLPTEPKR